MPFLGIGTAFVQGLSQRLVLREEGDFSSVITRISFHGSRSVNSSLHESGAYIWIRKDVASEQSYPLAQLSLTIRKSVLKLNRDFRKQELEVIEDDRKNEKFASGLNEIFSNTTSSQADIFVGSESKSRIGATFPVLLRRQKVGIYHSAAIPQFGGGLFFVFYPRTHNEYKNIHNSFELI